MFVRTFYKGINKNNFIAEEKGKEKDYEMSLAVGSRSKC